MNTALLIFVICEKLQVPCTLEQLNENCPLSTTLRTEVCYSADTEHTDECLGTFVQKHSDRLGKLQDPPIACRAVKCDVFKTTINCVNKQDLQLQCRKKVKAYADEKISENRIKCKLEEMIKHCPGAPEISSGSIRLEVIVVNKLLLLLTLMMLVFKDIVQCV